MGLCKSCVDKYKQKYMQRGFSEQEAERMATKLLKRVRRRHRYEILKGIRNSFQGWLYRWCFLTQWRATFLASLKNLSVTWVGRGFNPDYTQVCSGSCASGNCPRYLLACSTNASCQADPLVDCGVGTCDCAAPLANSTEVSNACGCPVDEPDSACMYCSGVIPNRKCQMHYYACTCGGTCGYNCNTGYSWNGSQCVLGGVAAKRLLRNCVHVGL